MTSRHRSLSASSDSVSNSNSNNQGYSYRRYNNYTNNYSRRKSPSPSRGEGRSSGGNGGGSGNTSGVIHLENSWTFWYDERLPKALAANSGDDYESRVKEIGSFSTVQDFWRYWNNIDTSKLPESNLRMFKQGIKPSWEDPNNANGGKWFFFVSKEQTGRIWTHLVLSIIGEQLEHGGDLCGVVLAIRPKNNNIAIWNRTSTDSELIEATGQQLRKLLSLEDFTKISYQPHIARPAITPSSTGNSNTTASATTPTSGHRRRRSIGRSRRNSFTEQSSSSSGNTSGGDSEREQALRNPFESDDDEGSGGTLTGLLMKSESCPRIDNFYSTTPSSKCTDSDGDTPSSPYLVSPRSRKGQGGNRLSKGFGSMSSLVSPRDGSSNWKKHRKSPSDSGASSSSSSRRSSVDATSIVSSSGSFIIETTPSRSVTKSRSPSSGNPEDADKEVPLTSAASQKADLPPLYPRAPNKTVARKTSTGKLPLLRKRTPSEQDLVTLNDDNSNTETNGTSTTQTVSSSPPSSSPSPSPSSLSPSSSSSSLPITNKSISPILLTIPTLPLPNNTSGSISGSLSPKLSLLSPNSKSTPSASTAGSSGSLLSIPSSSTTPSSVLLKTAPIPSLSTPPPKKTSQSSSSSSSSPSSSSSRVLVLFLLGLFLLLVATLLLQHQTLLQLIA